MKNKITILGQGCPGCKKLFEETKLAINESEKNIEIDYSQDITKAIELGILSLPVILFNDEIISTGKILTKEEIRKLIENKFID